MYISFDMTIEEKLKHNNVEIKSRLTNTEYARDRYNMSGRALSFRSKSSFVIVENLKSYSFLGS